MSAVLAHEQIQDVVRDLELLKDIRRAIADLRDSEISERERDHVCVSIEVDRKAVCFVHGGSEWLAGIALRAMEREIKARLASKDIEVEEAAS